MPTTDSAVQFDSDARIHIGLDVADLDRSIAFYRVLFGVGPTKIRTGYAKFELADPSVNLSLNESPGRVRDAVRPGSLHYGIQVKSSDAVRQSAGRLEQAGLAARIEEQEACCYAVQTKVWTTDPDGNPWEVFVVLDADAPRRSDAESGCCPDRPTAPAEAPSACCPESV